MDLKDFFASIFFRKGGPSHGSFQIDFFQLTQWRPFGSHLVEIYGILSAVGALGFVLEHYKNQRQ